MTASNQDEGDELRPHLESMCELRRMRSQLGSLRIRKFHTADPAPMDLPSYKSGQVCRHQSDLGKVGLLPLTRHLSANFSISLNLFNLFTARNSWSRVSHGEKTHPSNLLVINHDRTFTGYLFDHSEKFPVCVYSRDQSGYARQAGPPGPISPATN